ncbi:flagellar motor protein MotB [Tranquillimonas alkanivorans]|uniref:Chemotaxis protein MotB n=1 Tax=Tranquillimonas alkanivorans TaxID=441119 RepID=A0A1I5S6X4_9RHOB|nr:flagellar motor protein MotB [Tranquillimonas alkanivorans]SFP65996.1 chemotaxis protein MotB [Tranquillimonas alkanivorans]
MAGKKNEQIIIKRVEDDAHDAHHGGGWKVAYADFMTAMMAFFLLLWILAASDEEKLRGLADYFTPSLSEAGGRGQGLLEGTVLGPEGTMSGTEGPQSEVQLPSFGQENPLAVFDSRLRDQEPNVVVEYETVPDGVKPGEATPGAEKAAAERRDVVPDGEDEQKAEQQRTFEALEERIEKAVTETPGLADFTENLLMQRTPEGLLVQVVDHEGRSMFERGSARVGDGTRGLLRIVGEAVADLPNAIVISGHTDAVPFARQTGYGNWELSADRANATRRVLLDAGVAPSRISRVSGLAATQPLNADDPEAPENRRISVLLEYMEQEIPAQEAE